MNALLAMKLPISEIVVERLGWVLVHSLWQFALVSLLVGITMRAMRKSSAKRRYGVLIIALSLTVVAPVVTVCSVPAPSLAALPDNGVALQEGPESPGALDESSEPSLQIDGVSRHRDRVSVHPAVIPIDSTASARSQTGVMTLQPAERTASWSDRAATIMRPWLAWIVAVWSLGVVICSLRPLLGWQMLWRLKHVGVLPVSDEVLTAMRRVSSRLGVQYAVRVLQSTLARVPVVVGYVRPVILLPVSLMTSLPTSQLEAILAHELAHVMRHDFVVNVLQTLVETLFFYHPAVWWMSHQLRIEREHCCDDLVVELLGNRIEYGRALVAVAELRGKNMLLAPGATDGSLLSRVRRIVGAERMDWQTVAVRQNSRWPVALACLLSVGLAAAASTNWNAVADEKPRPTVRPEQYVAELPDGLKVEFIGLAPMGEEGKGWWKPDGMPLQPGPGDQFKTTSSVGGHKMLRAVIRVHGAKNYLDVTTNMTHTRDLDNRDPLKPVVTIHGGLAFVPPQSNRTVEVGVATQPLSPIRALDPTGNKLPPAPDAPADHIAEDIDVVIVVRMKSNNPRTADDARERTAITFASPVPANRQFDLDLKLIDKDGKTHAVKQISTNGPSAARNEITYAFDVPFQKVARFEYQMRPYQHWVTFENVSVEAGRLTDVTINVASLQSPEQTDSPSHGEVQPAKPTSANWPSFRHDLAQTGVATSSLPDNLEKWWEVSLGDEVSGTAAIVGDDVYVPCMSGELVCLNRQTGRRIWAYQSANVGGGNPFAPGFKSSPTVTKDTVYLGDESGVFHAIDRATGKVRWTFKTEGEIHSSAAVVGDRVLIGSYDQHLYCLHQNDGTQAWKFATEGYVHGTPAVVDGNAFVAGCDNHLRVIEIATGVEKTDIPLGTYLIASPTVIGDRLYVGHQGGEVLCVNWKAKSIVWRYATGQGEFPFQSSTAVTDKLVILGGGDKLVHAINRTTGKSAWTFATGSKVNGSPAVVGQRVFIGSEDGNLYELDIVSGKERWKFNLSHPITAAPAIGEGVLVIGSEGGNGKVVCFGGPRVAKAVGVSAAPTENSGSSPLNEYGPKDWAGWFVNQVSYRKQKDGSYPAAAFKHLRKQVTEGLSNEPDASGAADARAWLDATAADKNWDAVDFESMVERIGTWRLAIIQRALGDEEAASRSFPKSGRTATPEELKGLSFGPPASNGLRVAWRLAPAREEYKVGDDVGCRVVFHNSGTRPVQFAAWDVQDGTWTIRDAAGKELKTEDVPGSNVWSYPRVAAYQRYRLEPGQVVEVGGQGVGIGAGVHSASNSQIPIWRIIHAQPGNSVQISVETRLDVSVRFDEFPEEQARDWSGTLRSGELKFRVIAAADPNPALPVVLKPKAPAIVLPDHLNVMAVRFADEGRELITMAVENDVTIRRWNIARKELKSEVKLETKLHGNRFLMSQFKFSEDRRTVIGISEDRIGIWETATGKLIKMLGLPESLERSGLRGLAATPNLSLISCGLTSGSSGLGPSPTHTIVWDLPSSEVLQNVQHQKAIQIHTTALSYDGTWLAAGGQPGGAELWETSAGIRKHTWANDNPGRKHPDPEVSAQGANQVLALAFSPDGRWLAMGDMLGVKLMNVQSGELQWSTDAPFRFGMSALVFSKDGQMLARTATDKVVPIWSTQTGKLLAELPTEAHDGAFSDDGKWFAAGFTDSKHALAVWQLD